MNEKQSQLLEQLNKYLANTSKEDFIKDWEAVNGSLGIRPVETFQKMSDGSVRTLDKNVFYLHELLDRASTHAYLFDFNFTHLIHKLGYHESNKIEEFELFQKYEKIGELLSEFYSDIANLHFD